MTQTTRETANRVSDGFESGFMERDWESQIKNCDDYVLTPLFLELLSAHQPVLEAGCGSGRWMHFFKRHGIQATGVDWSPVLQQRSLHFDPAIPFDTGDLRNLPYPDGAFGAVIALGSPEHVIEGPRQIFREFYRVLRPGGVALVTVPYFSLLRSVAFRLGYEPVRRLKRSIFLRRLAGKPPAQPGNPVPRADVVKQRYRPDVYLEVDFEGYFFQYEFTKRQISGELELAGFTTEKLFGFDAETGLIITLGRLVGRYDNQKYRGKMNPLGKLLLRLLSPDQVGHMVCCVVRKPLPTAAKPAQ